MVLSGTDGEGGLKLALNPLFFYWSKEMKLELKKVEDPIDKAIEKLKEEILLQLSIAFEAGVECALESKEKEYKYDPNSSD